MLLLLLQGGSNNHLMIYRSLRIINNISYADKLEFDCSIFHLINILKLDFLAERILRCIRTLLDHERTRLFLTIAKKCTYRLMGVDDVGKYLKRNQYLSISTNIHPYYKFLNQNACKFEETNFNKLRKN